MRPSMRASLVGDSPELVLWFLGVNALVGEALKNALAEEDLSVTQFYSTVDEALDNAGETAPDAAPDAAIVFANAQSDDCAQVERFKKAFADTKIIVICSDGMANDWEPSVRSGIVNCLLSNNIRKRYLSSFVQLACAGHDVVSKSLYLQKSASAAPRIDKSSLSALSEREKLIMAYLGQGYPNKLIARKIDSSEAAVKLQLRRLMKKVNVRNRTQAAVLAAKFGLKPEKKSPSLEAGPNGDAPSGQDERRNS